MSRQERIQKLLEDTKALHKLAIEEMYAGGNLDLFVWNLQEQEQWLAQYAACHGAADQPSGQAKQPGKEERH